MNFGAALSTAVGKIKENDTLMAFLSRQVWIDQSTLRPCGLIDHEQGLEQALEVTKNFEMPLEGIEGSAFRRKFTPTVSDFLADDWCVVYAKEEDIKGFGRDIRRRMEELCAKKALVINSPHELKAKRRQRHMGSIG